LIQFLNPFFDLISDARMSRLDRDYRHRLIELAQQAPLAAHPEAECPSPARHWSVIPTLPLYMPRSIPGEVGC
jgi:hypothetical protein